MSSRPWRGDQRVAATHSRAGWCSAGAGIGLALAADLRIGSPRTVFATAFGAVGLAGDLGVTCLLDQPTLRERRDKD